MKSFKYWESELNADVVSKDVISEAKEAAVKFMDEGKSKHAAKLFTKILKLQTSQLGADDIDTLSTKQRLGEVMVTKKNFNEALRLYQEVLAALESKHGPSFPAVWSMKRNIAMVLCAMGNVQGAVEQSLIVLTHLKSIMTDNSPPVKQVEKDLTMYNEILSKKQ